MNQCSKVFGYTLFSEFLINNAPLPSLNENGRRARGVSDIDKRRMNYNTLASVHCSESMIIAFSYSQTSYFKHAYLSLQANRTKEAYKKCTLHIGCRLTRFEHFLRDIEQSVYRHESLLPRDSAAKDFPWLSEHLVQQFYNNALDFGEFLGVLLRISNFSDKINPSAQKVCWEVYYRENHSVLQKLALVNENSSEFIEHLFAIFTHLDRHVSCEISPFLMKQFITWWIKESETNPDKHFKLIEEWYESSDGQNATIDFIEFVDLIYKLFFRPFPVTTRHFLLKDAHHSLVSKVLKKGYLAKCGPNNSKYQVRWMILYPDRLEYFQRKSEEDMQKKGVILLGPRAAVKNVYDDDRRGHYKFTVCCTNSTRNFSIRADDMRIRMAWVTAIDQAIDVLKGNKGLQVFEKPLDLTSADHDFLRSSSISRGIDPLTIPKPRADVSYIPLPPPYNGAHKEGPFILGHQIDPMDRPSNHAEDLVEPLFYASSDFSLENDPLIKPPDPRRDNNRTLHIRNIDRDFADHVNSLNYESSCAVLPAEAEDTSSTDFRLQQFSSPSSSSSEEDEPSPALPIRQMPEGRGVSSINLFPEEALRVPVPAPRERTRRQPSEESPFNRVSMNTHPPYAHFTIRNPGDAPKVMPRSRSSHELPVLPARSLPVAPARADSLTKHRRRF